MYSGAGSDKRKKFNYVMLKASSNINRIFEVVDSFCSIKLCNLNQGFSFEFYFKTGRMNNSEAVTTLITGAGAVENAWEPISKTIKGRENVDVNSDVANQYLTLRVYLMKLHQHEKEKDSEKLNAIIDDFSNFKEAIAESLRNAQSNGELCIRPEFIDILEEFLPSNQWFVHINTNWDSVVDSAIQKTIELPLKTIHIHGEVRKHSTLYLPSEVFFEPYRNEKEIEELKRVHQNAARCINSSKRIILYGISMDPMDAELQMLFSFSIAESLEEIIIINLKNEHAKIAARIRMLIPPKCNARISAYDPGNLKIDTLTTNFMKECSSSFQVQ